MEKELPAAIVTQHEVQFSFGLKGVAKAHEERVLKRLEDFAFRVT